MVYKDEVCMWFKDNESHHRLELLCGLLNMCLPFELRFIRTCVEDLGKRDDLLRDFDSKANNASEISQLGKVLDERTRSKFVVYVALLEANNQTCSKILFETLSNAQQIPNSALTNNINHDNINYIKEMLLIYTMVLNHPAFTFEEKRIIGERLQSLQLVEEQINSKKSWHIKNTFEVDNDLSTDSCHPVSSPQVLEACDSGLSIGTEPEVEVLSEHVCIHSGIQPLHVSGNSSNDNKFADIIASKDLKTTNRPLINPSIGIKSSEKLPSNFNGSSSSSVMSISPPTEDGKPCSGNRDASSSGSGESLDLYGENISVPTTYIYNSNIYDQQNLTDMPALALSNNVINFTHGCMYQHNGRCHFYHYPSLMGGMPSVPLPRKLSPPALSSETSSSEEGGTLMTNSEQREALLSPLSSSHSSPYASPPQSLTPSRASSPKEAETMVTSSHISHGLITCTTTTIVISRSNQRPASRHSSSSCSSTGSSNSQPSSPALGNSINRNNNNNKPSLLSKCQKYSNDRLCNLNSENCSVETAPWKNGSSDVGLNKEISTDSYSSNSRNTILNAKNSPCINNDIKYCEKYEDPGAVHKFIPTSCTSGQNIEKESVNEIISNVSQNSTLTTTNDTLSINSLGPLAVQKETPNCVQTSPVKSNMKNTKDKPNKEISYKGKNMDLEKLGSKGNIEKEIAFISLPNGFNEHLLVSSAHLVPLKHSIVNTSSIPSCSCSHTTVPTVLLQSDSCKNNILSSGNNVKQKVPLPVPQSAGNTTHTNAKSGPNKHYFGSESSSLPNSQFIPNHSSIAATTTTTTMTTAATIASTLSTTTSYTSPSIMTSGLHSQPSIALLSTPPSLENVPECIKDGSLSEKNVSSVAKTSQTISSTSNATVVNMSSQSVCRNSSPEEKYIHTGGPIHISTNPGVNKSSHGENGHQVLSSSSIPTSQVGSCAKTTAVGIISSTFNSMTNTSSAIVSLVPNPATYPPYLSLPVLPGGASTFLSQGPYSPHVHGHPRNPSHAFFLASSAGVIHGNSNHLMKNHPHIPPSGPGMHNSKSRGSSGRSGSSSSSSSSGLSRKKGFIRGNQYQNKSRSSDSSPSSSQYSSPPQTPSPDHIKDVRSKPGGSKTGKPGEGYSVEEVWDPSDANGHCVPNSGLREEGTPPPHAMGAHIMIPSNPVRQRYIPYHPSLGFIGYPHPHSHHGGMYRYSLASPMVMGHRPPAPLNSEKSSRETTPPNHAPTHVGLAETSQKVIEYQSVATSTSATPSSYSMCGIVSTPSIGHSSKSPTIPGPMPEGSSVALVPPPPPPHSGHSGPPNGGMNSSIPHFSSPNYPMFAMGGNPFVAHLPGFMQSTSGMPNGYVSPHNLPPNYPVPSLPNGISSGELVYPNPYPVMGPQSTLPTSSCGGHPALHHSSGTHHAPILSPSHHGLPPFTPYQNAPPPPLNPVPPPLKKPYTCYNCGKVGHRGSECKEASIEEMTKRTKVL